MIGSKCGCGFRATAVRILNFSAQSWDFQNPRLRRERTRPADLGQRLSVAQVWLTLAIMLSSGVLFESAQHLAR